MNFWIGGINGVGKSTILKRVAVMDENLEYVSTSQLLMNHLGLGGDYEKFRALPQSKKVAAMGVVMNQIKSKKTTICRLFDGHYTNLIYGDFSAVTGGWIEHMDGLVLIAAPLNDVYRRIESDYKTRDRGLYPNNKLPEGDKVALLSQFADLEETEFKQLAARYSLKNLKIKHKNDQIDQDASRIIDFVNTK